MEQILGAIVGDIAGSLYEWHNVKTKHFEMLPTGSRFTDDTVMTLAVAKWLTDDPAHHHRTLVKTMQELGQKYPLAGYGGSFSKWLTTPFPHPYGSWGNGSGMRVSPVGLFAHSLDEALQLARISAEVTHNHPEGIKGAQAIAACVYLAKNEKAVTSQYLKKLIHHYITANFGYDLSRTLDSIRPTYHFDVSCQGSVPEAIIAYLEGHTFEDVLRGAISIGGDSDTIAAMACSIAAAQGTHEPVMAVPQAISFRCMALLPEDLRIIQHKFIKAISPTPTKHNVSIQSANSLQQMTKESATRVKRERIRGSLVGGAIGDALGYAVEFASWQTIKHNYGIQGITRYKLNSNGVAEISDDTQMSLFTANGLLTAQTLGVMTSSKNEFVGEVLNAYLDWYRTQRQSCLPKDSTHTWLSCIPTLYSCRAPGNTCLNALAAWESGNQPNNTSKGCGGVMRTAPVGLFCATRGWNIEDVMLLGGECARLTHRHALGYLPAALLSGLVCHIVEGDCPDQIHFEYEVLDLCKLLTGIYSQEVRYTKQLYKLLFQAIQLAHSDTDDETNIRTLGEGWVGEETLAIAVYAATRYFGHFEKAIITAVNHSGDSDSTGAVCGNIVGALAGYSKLPQHFLENLELREVIEAMADDLCDGCPVEPCDDNNSPRQRQWLARYIHMEADGIKSIPIIKRNI